MFVWAKIPKHFYVSADFVMELFEQTGGIITPGSAFGPSGEGYVRMALVQDEPELLEVIRRIEACGLVTGKE